MLSKSSIQHHARIAAVILLAGLCAGCSGPLAWQHEFFLPLGRSADRIGTQAQHATSHHRALQAAQRACRTREGAPALQDERNLPAGPNPAMPAARQALAELCATRGRPPAAAYGGVSNAYRRWVEDEVRELPEASETAASAAGGS